MQKKVQIITDANKRARWSVEMIGTTSRAANFEKSYTREGNSIREGRSTELDTINLEGN